MPAKYYVKFHLGACHLRSNNTSEALRYFEAALGLGPKEEEIATICSYMGQCLKEKGQYREALKILEKGNAYDADRTDIYNLMGFCHYKLKEHEKAIGCFQEVLRIDPSSAIDYANVASNYREMGNKDLAIQFYEFALALDPTIEFARDNLGRLKT